MKKIWKYMIVALAGLSLLACNKEKDLPEEEIPSVDKYTYTIAITGDTRAHFNDDHMTWDEGDLIGWFINDEAPDCSEINYNENPRSFDVTSSNALPANSTVYAYAPFYTFYFDDNPTKTAAPLSIPVNQDGLIYDAMPMVSLPIVIADAKEAKANTPVAEASFINLGAVIEYNVYTTNSSYNAEKIESISFASDSNIAGDFTVDLTSVSASSIPAPSGLTRNTVISTLATATTVGGSKADGVKVYQVVAPGTWSGTVTVTTDAAVYEYTITSKEFNRAKIRTLNVDLGSENAARTENMSIEDLLTSHEWVLTGVNEEGRSVTTSTGNKLTLNSDYSMSFDCSAHDGKTFDHTWEGDYISPDAYGAVSDMEWCYYSEDGKDYLGISSGFLLVFAQTNTEWSVYEIKELTDTKLTVDIVTEFDWGSETWTLLFEAEDTSSGPMVEDLLTAHQWVLTGVNEEGRSVTTSTGNKLTLNSDYSMSFDCSAHDGKTFDHTWEGDYISPDAYGAVSDMEWCYYSEDGKDYLGISSGFLLVFAQTNTEWSVYEIKELTDTKLTVDIVTEFDWGSETWTLFFEAVSGAPM